MTRPWRPVWLAWVIVWAMATPALAQTDPSLVGQWSTVISLPVEPIHAHVLPNGEVLFWPTFDAPYVWNVTTGQTTPVAAGYNIFCSAHCFLADGRLLVAGGHEANNVGLPFVSWFDPSTGWSGPLTVQMNDGRWYPTTTLLPSGEVLIVSGDRDTSLGVNPLPQVFQAATDGAKDGSFRHLTDALLGLPLYPWMAVAPDGRVFNSGPGAATRSLDPTGTGAWTFVANRVLNLFRDYGSSVMYMEGKILVMGGADPPTDTAEVVDLTAAAPAWRQVGTMHLARRQINATILPDGTVLVTGGTSGSGFNNTRTPVYAAEVWDPGTERWTTLASASRPRLYHSTAFLLPDGRVVSAGGDNERNAQVYSPPYLFKGTRPAITSAPATVTYGQEFTVETPDADAITDVTWLRLASVTHAFDQNQRFNRLAFGRTTGALNVTAPANANLAPPGHYMLFVLRNGVPSVAKVVRLQTAAGGSNTAPTASDQTATTDEDRAVTVGLGASDPEECDLVFSIVTPPAHGTLGSIVDQACTTGSPNVDQATVLYTPNANFNGSDSFVYKARDGSLGSNVAMASITVKAVNDAPVANDQAGATVQDTAIDITLTGSDPDSCDLGFIVVTGPSNGTLGSVSERACVAGVPNRDSAVVSYTPNPGFIGMDSFTFKTNDGPLDGNTATVSVSVTAPPAGNANDMYVWDIAFESRIRGKNHDERIVVTVRRDSDADGVAEATDSGAASASVTVEVKGPATRTVSGITDSTGVFRTDWLTKLPAGTYTAEVTSLGHPTFTWKRTLDPTVNDTDLDADDLPDQRHAIPH